MKTVIHIDENKIMNKRAAPNERFYESGGVCPQILLC
jgi:hypothetical protein